MSSDLAEQVQRDSLKIAVLESQLGGIATRDARIADLQRELTEANARTERLEEDVRDANGDLAAALRGQSEANDACGELFKRAEKAEARWTRLTAMCTRLGWEHCTTEVELIAQVEKLVAERARMNAIASASVW